MAFETDTGTPEVPKSNRGVAFIRRDLLNRFDDYDLVFDCLSGSRAVKDKMTEYLPMPDATNLTEDNLARYRAYLTRAVFYNVTQRTALGLQGQVFLRPPVVQAPKSLDPVLTDSNGAGISVEQLARDATWFVLGGGRAGIFIDYPPREGVATRSELQSGNVRPTISIYGPKNVINWQERIVGARRVLSLVVLVEPYTVDNDDPFVTEEGIQFRELRLSTDNVYSVQVWRPNAPGSTEYVKFENEYTPKGGNGKPLDAIPFSFIGAKNNEPSIDPPPLLDMANINIAHYRNSADYEESVFVVGQPTLKIIGISKEWFDTVLKGKVAFGARGGLPLPQGADAGLLQAEPNTLAFEAMEHKERQMVALGAKIVEQRTVQRTATEFGGEKATEESVLSAIANNVSAAFKWALEWCAVFLNVPETGIEFKLNTDFELSGLTAEELTKVIKSWQDEALSWTEMRHILRKAGHATQDDKDALSEIEEARTKAIENAAREIGKTTKDALQAEGGAGNARNVGN